MLMLDDRALIVLGLAINLLFSLPYSSLTTFNFWSLTLLEDESSLFESVPGPLLSRFEAFICELMFPRTLLFTLSYRFGECISAARYLTSSIERRKISVLLKSVAYCFFISGS